MLWGTENGWGWRPVGTTRPSPRHPRGDPSELGNWGCCRRASYLQPGQGYPALPPLLRLGSSSRRHSGRQERPGVAGETGAAGLERRRGPGPAWPGLAPPPRRGLSRGGAVLQLDFGRFQDGRTWLVGRPPRYLRAAAPPLCCCMQLHRAQNQSEEDLLPSSCARLPCTGQLGISVLPYTV